MNLYSLVRAHLFIACVLLPLSGCGGANAQTPTLDCSYTITNDWGAGLTAEISIKNSGSVSVNNWAVSWQYATNKIVNSWNATLSGSNPYSATNLSWNGKLNPGQSASFGVQVDKQGGSAEVPVINGAYCSQLVASSVSSQQVSSQPISSAQNSSSVISSASMSSVSVASQAGSSLNSSVLSVSSSSVSSSLDSVVAVSLGGVAGDSNASLSWTITGAINSLEIYRDTDSNPVGRTRIATLTTSARSYTATNLTNGTHYWFWVKVRSVAGATINSNAMELVPIASASSSSLQSSVASSSQSSTSSSASIQSSVFSSLSSSSSSKSSASSAMSSSSSSVLAACVTPKADNVWAGSTCSTPPNTICVSGSWLAPKDGGENGAPLRIESEHFAVYWKDGTNITTANAQTAVNSLESIWNSYFGAPIFFPEPYCNSAQKYKAAVHFDNDYPLWGGGWSRNGINYMGMWVGPLAAQDKWGLAHEFMHGVQSTTQGFQDCGGVGCWIYESHANWMPHQITRDNVHCSEMLVNTPHLYYGSTRNRYCNWQFFEFLKDKYCPAVINDMWAYEANAGQRDPWQKLMLSKNWSIEQLNDRFGEWAMHNVTWDYQNPDGSDQGAVYRSNYGAINADAGNYTQRRLRLTKLEALDSNWSSTRRFSSPYYWAPQRWGYNIIQLFPEAGATEIKINFRGVIQAGANSGWRWGLVSTNSAMTQSRYTELQKGTDGELTLCITPGENVFLVVVGTPTAYQKITWDNPSDGRAYPSIYRYPYMLEIKGAWPDGFKNGQLDACPAGTVRHSNGNGCAPAGTPASVFVGPYAKILGGNVTGNARIEDQATIVNGTMSGGTLGALTLLGVNSNPHHGASSVTVTDSARVMDTFYPLGWFGSNQSVSGNATLIGDLEFISTNKNTNTYYGFVSDDWNGVTSATEVTLPPPYTWRP